MAEVERLADDGPVFPTRLRGYGAGVAMMASVLVLVSACGATSGRLGAATDPSTSTMPLGPGSTVTVDVTGATPPPTIDVATLSLRAGNPTFREFRTVRTPTHQRFAFTPPPGTDGMGVVVRVPVISDPSQSMDCTVTVDGVVVDREEHVYSCSYSSVPRWAYVLIKGVIPGRYWPPNR